MTGLYCDGARWYDAQTGTFLSEYPLSLAAGDANLTRYVGNDPVNATDPLGLYGTNVEYQGPAQGAAGNPLEHPDFLLGVASGAGVGAGFSAAPGALMPPGSGLNPGIGNGDGFVCPCCMQAFGIRGVYDAEDIDGGGPSEGDGAGVRVVMAGWGGGGFGGGGGGGAFGGGPGGPGTNGFWGSIGSSLYSIGQTYVGIYQWATSNPNYSTTYQSAYNNGPFGQTQNDTGIYYYGTRGAIGVATIAGTTASGLMIAGAGGGMASLNELTGGGFCTLWGGAVPSEAAIAGARAAQAAQDLEYLEMQLADLEANGMGSSGLAESMRQAIETARTQIAFWRQVAGG